MRLTPRDPRFFDLLTTAASHGQQAAELLVRLVRSPPSERPDLARRLKEVEHAGDDTTHEIMRVLNTSFITPFDREDIASLAGGLDDVLDDMEEAGDLTVLYGLDGLPTAVAEQADTLRQAADLTLDAMPRLRSLKDLESYWIAINDLENIADGIHRRAVAELFNEEAVKTPADVVRMFKVKEVVDQLESAADGYEALANVVQSIAAKES